MRDIFAHFCMRASPSFGCCNPADSAVAENSQLTVGDTIFPARTNFNGPPSATGLERELPRATDQIQCTFVQVRRIPARERGSCRSNLKNEGIERVFCTFFSPL